MQPSAKAATTPPAPTRKGEPSRSFTPLSDPFSATTCVFCGTKTSTPGGSCRSTSATAHHHPDKKEHSEINHVPGHVGPLRLTLSSFPPPSAGSGHAATVVCAGCLHSSNT
ncbi:exo-alpha-sialidase [Trypanosoma cruzi]|nr:exo-alpha-sialidase [Trypanosoma cruzi]